MPEELLEMKTVLLAAFIIVLLISRISAQVRIWKLKDYCESLKKVNDNLTRTFPDIKVLMQAFKKQEQIPSEPAEPVRLQIFRAVRADGAPDLNLGDIAEVIIAAQKRDSAVKLLKGLEQIKDDGWWILEDIRQEQVVNMKHLGGLNDE